MLISDQFRYSHTKEVAPGVMLYLDADSHAIGLEIRGAAKFIDTKGLVPMFERPITGDELKRRMMATPAGRTAWTLVQPRIA